MEQEIQKINKLIDELNALFDSLKSSTTLPLDIVEAMRKRLSSVSGDSNSTSTSIATQAVNEGGVATYNVAKVPTGFITIVINGNSRNVPYY